MRILVGFLFVIGGALITIYSEAIFGMFGRVNFAEKFLGSSGGSRLFYKLLGVLFVIIGFLIKIGRAHV